MSKLTTYGRRLIFFSLTILMMIFIFFMSSETGEESADFSIKVTEKLVKIIPGYTSMVIEKQESIFDCVHFAVRKGAHFTEYGILALMILGFLNTFKISRCIKCMLTIGVSGAYAVLDEIHQLFVSKRNGNVRDVLIDISGAIVFTGIAIMVAKMHKPKSGKNLNLNLQ